MTEQPGRAGEMGRVIRFERRRLRMTQRALAEAVGVDFTYVSKLENGRNSLPPSAQLLMRLSDVLGVAFESLLVLSGRTERVPASLLARLQKAADAKDCHALMVVAREISSR